MSSQLPTASLPKHHSIALIIAVLFVSMALMGTAQAAGELDMSFNNGGKVFTDFSNKYDVAYDMVVQPDGKIVVVGSTHSDFTVWHDFGIARYNSDGSLDTTFGTGGKVATNISLYDYAYGVALQPDGKIVVVGSTVAFDGVGQIDFAIARYNSNGTLDSTFGNGGKVIIDFFTADDIAKEVVIQPDNKMVVGGEVRFSHPSVGDSDFGLVRLNSDGSLDTTFDGDGKVTTHIPSGLGWTNDSLAALALTPDGKIVAAGASVDKFSMARYNPNGSLDTTFDTDGMLYSNFAGADNQTAPRAMVFQPDGKIITTGLINAPAYDTLALARFNTDGTLDTTFDGDGIATAIPPGNQPANITDIALTAEGKIVLSGYNNWVGFTAVRYLPNGSLDTAFGERGRFFTHLTNAFPRALASAVQADGKILLAGQTSRLISENSDFVILRYQANPKSFPVRSDFDGDGRSDISVFRPSSGVWYVLNSSDGGFRAQPFGTSGDIAAPGDYDGDGGATDFAVFRPSNGTWYILNSFDNSFRAERFGATGDVPVPADYDGDFKTDVAVYRPSNGYWYILRSSDHGFQAQAFGISTDRPLPGYWDGDEKADLAVFRASEGRWYIWESATGTLRVAVWGGSGDQPATGDFDGDGKFDLAVFRPSTRFWYISTSAISSPQYIQFGEAGDIAVPGDYNGDFVTELAMWRPSNGNWYFQYPQPPVWFGTSGDTPVLNAYMP
ncbi:MAG: FG-GAP repeat protein [Acidobacteria bacterium]|nr:FG-GAP repeat protein [Acidobacteriota bacterium]